MITEREAGKIKWRYKVADESSTKIAEDYPISYKQVWRIGTDKRWSETKPIPVNEDSKSTS